MKKQTEKPECKVISFPEDEKKKRERKLEKSVSDLVDIMRELAELGRKTGTEGLPESVYLAFCHVLMDATRLAVMEERRDHHAVDD